MKKKELYQYLEGKLNSKLENLGYVGSVNNDGVQHELSTLTGRNIISQYCTTYSDEFGLYITLQIFNNQVEDLRAKIKNLTPKERNKSVTILFNTMKYNEKKLHAFSCKNYNDLDEWIELTSAYLTNIGFDFFSKYQSLEALNQLINSDTSKLSEHFPYMLKQAETGLIIATLLKKADFNALVLSYKNTIKQENENLEDFQVVVKKL